MVVVVERAGDSKYLHCRVCGWRLTGPLGVPQHPRGPSLLFCPCAALLLVARALVERHVQTSPFPFGQTKFIASAGQELGTQAVSGQIPSRDVADAARCSMVADAKGTGEKIYAPWSFPRRPGRRAVSKTWRCSAGVGVGVHLAMAAKKSR